MKLLAVGLVAAIQLVGCGRDTLPPASPPVAQAPKDPAVSERRLFGVALRPSTIGMLTDVETFFGKAVQEARSDALTSSFAQTRVLDDGTPVITISSSESPSEEFIAHELFHLRLYTLGVPEIEWFGGPEVEAKFTKEVVALVMRHIRDPIQHHLFYPVLRGQGLNPEGPFNQKLVELLDANEPDPWPGVDESYRAIMYFHAYLECNDETLRARVDQYFRARGWSAAADRGRKWAEAVQQAKATGPETEVNLFANCANGLMDAFQFSLRKWEPHSRVKSVRILTVNFDVRLVG